MQITTRKPHERHVHTICKRLTAPANHDDNIITSNTPPHGPLAPRGPCLNPWCYRGGTPGTSAYTTGLKASLLTSSFASQSPHSKAF